MPHPSDTAATGPEEDPQPFPMPPPGSMGPPPQYPRLRRECPLAKVATPFGAPAWYATRYDDVRDLLADDRFVRPTIEDWPPGPDADRGPGLLTMMELEGPRHAALRQALARPFSVRAVRRRRPALRAAADHLLERFTTTGPPGDLVSGFCEPFPLLATCELVGIPYDDRDFFLPPADAALGALITLPEGREATHQLRAYMESLLDRLGRTPGDDILSVLVRACDHGAVDRQSVLAFGLSMLVAGYRTTTMFLANAALALLSEPERYARLLRDRALLPAAVEELLRFLPVQNGVIVLQAQQDVALHGRTVRAGEAVLPVLAAANRDERVFPAADRLLLDRSSNPHLAFGRGPHNCIGAHLARAQMSVGLEALLVRLPRLRLTGEPPAWEDHSPIRSPLTLPVTW
ncbi:cytochrome P450 [Streptomyces griseoflavus]|uniref:cytochrome P450 n=1 Tax=Streptomyces rimosus TaxID=1927 RepID=UPI0004CC5079|nr:cytochrome P450 [Streptomyces rimosus]KOG52585.1 cytochrome P450 [Streptomyces griseoflavus]